MFKNKPIDVVMPPPERLSKNNLSPIRWAVMSQLFTERVDAINVAKIMSVAKTFPTPSEAN